VLNEAAIFNKSSTVPDPSLNTVNLCTAFRREQNARRASFRDQQASEGIEPDFFDWWYPGRRVSHRFAGIGLKESKLGVCSMQRKISPSPPGGGGDSSPKLPFAPRPALQYA